MSESEAWSETQTIHTNDCTTLGNGYSSVVRAAESSWKGRSFESLQERRESFLLRGQLSVLTLISVSAPPPS